VPGGQIPGHPEAGERPGTLNPDMNRPSTRLRVTFSKTGALRYTGHLDLHKIWERTVRRAGLPLAYSQGFHPQPKMQLACALPLGFLGQQEVMDLWLEMPPGSVPVSLLDLLQRAAPPGLTILKIEEVDAGLPALQTQVDSADYEVILLDPVDRPALGKRLAALLEAGHLERERRGKAYDLRPLIETLQLMPEAGSGAQRIAMRLSAREGATGRPEEVLEALGVPGQVARIERTRLILKSELK
jgi:radical SAM-linked protein